MTVGVRGLLLTFAVLLAACPAAAADRYAWPVQKVISGGAMVVRLDTLPTWLRDTPVELDGVSFPHQHGNCQKEKILAIRATEYTRHRVETADVIKVEPVTVEPVEWGPHGRIVGKIWVNGENLAADLIKQGLAYPDDGIHQKWWCP